MGFSGLRPRRFHAPHRLLLGWLRASEVVMVEPTGPITLTSASLVQAGRSVAAIVSVTRGQGQYQLSLRTVTAEDLGYDR